MITTHASWLKRFPFPFYQLAAQLWIDYRWPRHLFIETTAACNLTCDYCPRERRGSHMDFARFQSIIDEATHYGPRSFSLHLFGEPFLYPRLFDAISYIKSKHQRHRILLTTNGTRLERDIDRLVTSAIDQVFWTWRPEVTFSEATKAKLRRWGKFRVRFIAEITPPEAYAEWQSWPNVEGRPLHNYGGTIDLTAFHTSTASAPTVASRWSCYHLWLAPAVAWNGDLLICCADPHHAEVVGRFPAMSVAQMWRSPKLQSLRHAHQHGQYDGICTNCDVWKQYPDLFFNWQKR